MKEYNGGFSNDIGLFKEAKDSQVHRHVIWFCVLAFLITLAGALIPTIIGQLLLSVGLISEFVNFFVFQLVLSFGSMGLVVYMIARTREKRSMSQLGLARRNALPHYVHGFLIGLFLMGLAVFLMVQLGGLEVVQTDDGVGLKYLPTIVLVLIGWVIQGGTEELICRGWMLPQLGTKYNVPFAIVVTSLFFMLLHGANSSINLIPLLNLFLFGVFAALFVVYHKDLWGICGMHAAWNWMQGNVLGIEVSGSSVPGGSLIKLQATGKTMISGGSFGVEGSLITTLIFLGACIYYFYRIKKNA